MAKSPSLNVLINGDPSALLAAFTTSSAAAAGWQKKLKAIALSPPAMFAAAAVGVGVVLYGVGKEFDEAYDRIRVGTGATGEALDILKDDFKGALAAVPDDAATVGGAIADLNTRLGLTGEPLQDITEQFLDLSRITGTDVSSNIANMTRVFGDWSVSTEDTSGTMDQMFRASQATGIGMDQLSAGLVKFGAPMRQLGFSFTESTALISQFEKEGVNSELVMGSMRIALGRMAKAGEDPIATFNRVTDEIKNAGSAGEANALALEMFGSKAGPDMAAAIREGRFEIDELHDAIANGTDTIASATDDTADMTEHMAELKNAVKVAVEPAATVIFDNLGKAMGWVTENASWLIPVVGGLAIALGIAAAATAALNLVMALNPIVLITLLIAGLVAGVIVAYHKFEGFRNVVDSVWQGIQTAIDFAWNNIIKPIWELISWYIENVLIRYFKLLFTIYKTVFETIAAIAVWAWETIIRPIWDAIYGFIVDTLIPGIQTLLAIWKAVFDGVVAALSWAWGFISGVFDSMKGGISSVASWIGDRVGDLVGFFTSLPGRIGSAIAGLWDGLTGSFKNALNLIIGLWNGLRIPSFTFGGWDTPFGKTPSFTTPEINFPDLPTFHSGGLFTADRPGGVGLAMLRDGERVLTPAQQNTVEAGPMAGMSRGGVNVYVTNAAASADDIGRAVLWNLKVAG